MIPNQYIRRSGSYRQFYQWSDPKVLIKLYTTMVRPHLEYAAPVWSPELVKDISKLENVQKFAIRVYTKQWNLPYIDFMEKCNLTELRTCPEKLPTFYTKPLMKTVSSQTLPLYPMPQRILSQLTHLCYLSHVLICFRTPLSPTTISS